MIYLLHFEAPFRHARHYLGFVDGGEEQLAARMKRHKSGQGAKLLRAVGQAGIGWKAVRIWPDGDRRTERKLKRRRNAGTQLCPVCRREVAYEEATDYANGAGFVAPVIDLTTDIIPF